MTMINTTFYALLLFISVSVLGAANAPVISDGILLSAGETWIARDQPRYWASIASSSNGTKLAAVDKYKGIYTSTDSGVTWTARDISHRWNQVTSSSDGTKLAAVAISDYIYTSSDSGVTWTARNTSRYWSCIASSRDGTKLVAGEDAGAIYTSTDSGRTWTERRNYGHWRAIASSSDGTKLAVASDGYKIYTSIDSGITWTQQNSESLNWTAIASSDDGRKLIAVARNDKIYTSTDSGVTWTARDTRRVWSGVASSSDGTKLVAVAAAGGQIHTSIDSGITWTERAVHGNTMGGWSCTASSSDGTKLVAATNGGQIYTSQGSRSISVTMSEDSQPTAFSLTLNASDADADTLTWSIIGAATHGTAKASGTGSSKKIGYTPTANYNGSDSFVVQVSDGTLKDSITVNVTINPVEDASVITWATPATITYGTPLSVTQLNATANVPGTFVYTPALGTVLHAGIGQTLSVTFTPSDSVNYSPASATTFLTVTQAPLTITANNQSMVVGQTLPTLMAVGHGFISPDTLASLDTAVLMTTTATSRSLVGTYSIIASGATDVDYNITYIDGILTVTESTGGSGDGGSNGSGGKCGLGGGLGVFFLALMLAFRLALCGLNSKRE